MKGIKFFCTVVSSIVLLSSCASILNSKQQKVTVFTTSPDSKVFINDTEQGNGKVVPSKLERNLDVQQIKITTNGFKDQYLVHYQTKKSPLYYMSCFPFGALILPPFLDSGKKSYDFEKEIYCKEKLIPIAEKSETEKFVFLKNAEVTINPKDLKVTKSNFSSYVKDKIDKENLIDSITKDIKFDNAIFTNSLNKSLVKYDYTDTTGTIYKNKSNSAFVSANITKLNLQSVYKRFCGSNMIYLKIEAEITWDFLDIYGQSIYSKKTTTKSGDFSFDYYKEKVVATALEDAVSNSFLNFMNKKKVKGNLKKSKFGAEPKQKILELFKGSYVDNMDDALNSTVTIKAKNGSASGFKVGKDGYIITNFNIIANSEDKITIITKDNKEYEGKLIRKNESLDLALIRVDATFDKHFEIAKENTINTGDSIFLIGTPKSIDLGQTISKGTISGYKENEGVKFIQTDANINDENSGGPMIDKDGKLIGIINAKFCGLTKGDSFVLPSELLTSSLFIK